jgi:hypothetical protein
VPPPFTTAVGGSTTQDVTLAGVNAVWQEPPRHCWPLGHSLSSPQAGGRQTRSSQTSGEMQSDAEAQIWMH